MVRSLFLCLAMGHACYAINISKYKDFAYVFCSQTNSIDALGIDNNGDWEELPDSNIYNGLGIGVDGVTTIQSESYIYFVNWDTNNVSMFKPDFNTGLLNPIAKPVQSSIQPFSISISPDSKFAYAGGYASNTIKIYKIGSSNGELTVLTTNTHPNGVINLPGLAPTSIRFNSVTNTMYVVNQKSNDIVILDYDPATGEALPRKKTVPTYGMGGRAIVIVKNKYLYITNEFGNTISMFRISHDNGDLEYMGQVNVGISPIFMTVDKSESFAYVSNQGTNNVTMFLIDQDSGVLIPQNPQQINSTGVGCRNIYAREQYVYQVNQGDRSITVYAINPSNGQLIFKNKKILNNKCAAPRGMGFVKNLNYIRHSG